MAITPITTANLNKLRMQKGDGTGDILNFYDLAEPSVIPEVEEQIRYEEHQTRPGRSASGGWRTFSLFPSSPNRGNMGFRAGFITPAQLLLVRSWQRAAPPTVRVTNDDSTWYLAALRGAKPFNYDFNQRSFHGIEFDLPIMIQL